MSAKQVPPHAYSGAKQRDLAVEVGPNCPTCGRSWDKMAIRVCRLCGEPIARSHKYRMVPAGPGLFALEHRKCADPAAPR